jgi:hypothetical protein
MAALAVVAVVQVRFQLPLVAAALELLHLVKCLYQLCLFLTN